MGCIAKFILTALAFWGFGVLGWITLVEGASFFWAVFWAIVIMAVVDVLLIGFKFLAQIAALPASCLTVGVVVWVIEGCFKYIGLYTASLITKMFILPWIVGPLWFQAFIIALAFGLIAYLLRPRTVYHSSSSSSNKSS